MEGLWLFLIFLKAAMLSVGGMGGLPLLRGDLIPAGLATDAMFVQAITIGRISTGPGGLYVLTVGYYVMGPLGALAALLASILPPLLILPIAGYIAPRRQARPVDGLLRGLALSTSGLAIAVSIILLASPVAESGVSYWQLAVAAAAVALGYHGRHHPILVLSAAAALGLLLTR